jgi:hypothetical protein
MPEVSTPSPQTSSNDGHLVGFGTAVNSSFKFTIRKSFIQRQRHRGGCRAQAPTLPRSSSRSTDRFPMIRPSLITMPISRMSPVTVPVLPMTRSPCCKFRVQKQVSEASGSMIVDFPVNSGSIRPPFKYSQLSFTDSTYGPWR